MDRIIALVEDVPDVSSDHVFWMIDHVCRVDKLTYKIVAAVLCAFACVASTARITFRFQSAQALNFEDYFVLFATTCLVAESALILAFVDTIYTIDGATIELSVLRHVIHDTGLSKKFLESGSSIFVAYNTLGWVSIFAVKYSFLALFYKICSNVSRKLTAFFWVTVAATGMCGAIVILEGFILCPRFGAGATQCFLEHSYTFSISSGVMVQSLDIATDLMIISIPLTLLKMSHLRMENQVRIAVVLCLSSVCVVLSIIRLAAGMHRNVFGKWQFGMAWVTFMLHCEAAVAVMAGSMPALRAVYTSRRTRPPKNDYHEKGLTSSEGKTRRVLFSCKQKHSPVLPVHKQARSRASIANWRQSIVGIMPRSAGNKRYECSSPAEEGPVMPPGLAYHDFKKQEKKAADGPKIPERTFGASGTNCVLDTKSVPVADAMTWI